LQLTDKLSEFFRIYLLISSDNVCRGISKFHHNKNQCRYRYLVDTFQQPFNWNLITIKILIDYFERDGKIFYDFALAQTLHEWLILDIFSLSTFLRLSLVIRMFCNYCATWIFLYVNIVLKYNKIYLSWGEFCMSSVNSTRRFPYSIDTSSIPRFAYLSTMSITCLIYNDSRLIKECY